MDDAKQQVADRLKQATNILVTVKTNPSIDLLAACLGLSLILDKIGKHATAVFSGEVPSVMEFLKPEETLEQTPNSLRDFIISLDKSKADKLRYKVEDKVVRIFITPFKAGLSQDDLEFSQGDFNIDLMVALGVREQAELDNAVTAHGRILHDATIISINTAEMSNLGNLHWQGTNVSSVSEMIAGLAKLLDVNIFDEQIATALLTGIVAETARFSNDKTSPQTMSIAGELMAAGANQQLVATELQTTTVVGAPGSVKADLKTSEDNGTLEIKHTPDLKPPAPISDQPTGSPNLPPLPNAFDQPTQTIQPTPRTILPMPDPGRAGGGIVSDVTDMSVGADEGQGGAGPAYLIDKVSHDTPKVSPAAPAAMPPITDLPPVQPLATSAPVAEPVAPTVATLPPVPTPAPSVTPPVSPPPPADDTAGQTLEQLEESVDAHQNDQTTPVSAAPPATTSATRLDDARQQVLDALKQGAQPLEPLAALNAQPLGAPLNHGEPTGASVASSQQPEEGPTKPVTIDVDNEGNMRTLSGPVVHPEPTVVPSTPANPPASPNAPPPVPPPLPTNFGQ